ncbi:hypothetical protein AB835_02905 [Candidatus Endobugula sertula]|uniref:TonB C-terminal domain-containing protein n=1 Tax=Candidatus Endobugula sertula TaxID=62101 RepID=A0A1D2QSV5_9GAMM|nr:hypothetical protein AB835_02905 [Candidatus Endobugula sertula]
MVTTTSSDRLSFTVFLALAVHGLLIFGLSFNSNKPSESAPSITVTLATHTSSKAPNDADFLAQSNQLGSGTKQTAREITTDVISPFDSSAINETLIHKQRKQTVEKPEGQQIITSINSTNSINNAQQPDEKKVPESGEDIIDVDSVSAQIASLKAKLAEQRQHYAKIPRERVLTSVSTLASNEAAYLNQWTEKVETIGNRYFPQEAIRQKITGKLRLQVVIKHDGTIVEVNLKESAEHSIFNNAALQIVHQAAPFPVFPPDIRQDYEHLVIIRTWHFDISGLTTEQ